VPSVAGLRAGYDSVSTSRAMRSTSALARSSSAGCGDAGAASAAGLDDSLEPVPKDHVHERGPAELLRCLVGGGLARLEALQDCLLLGGQPTELAALAEAKPEAHGSAGERIRTSEG
jgi:hypothetical protein